MKATLGITLKHLDFLKPLFCPNVFERVDTLLRTRLKGLLGTMSKHSGKNESVAACLLGDAAGHAGKDEKGIEGEHQTRATRIRCWHDDGNLDQSMHYTGLPFLPTGLRRDNAIED